jgi:hypothetical protein
MLLVPAAAACVQTLQPDKPRTRFDLNTPEETEGISATAAEDSALDNVTLAAA